MCFIFVQSCHSEEKRKMNQPLSFQTEIPTIYREPREYLVMDAIFYWED